MSPGSCVRRGKHRCFSVLFPASSILYLPPWWAAPSQFETEYNYSSPLMQDTMLRGKSYLGIWKWESLPEYGPLLRLRDRVLKSHWALMLNEVVLNPWAAFHNSSSDAWNNRGLEEQHTSSHLPRKDYPDFFKSTGALGQKALIPPHCMALLRKYLSETSTRWECCWVFSANLFSPVSSFTSGMTKPSNHACFDWKCVCLSAVECHPY